MVILQLGKVDQGVDPQVPNFRAVSRSNFGMILNASVQHFLGVTVLNVVIEQVLSEIKLLAAVFNSFRDVIHLK